MTCCRLIQSSEIVDAEPYRALLRVNMLASLSPFRFISKTVFYEVGHVHESSSLTKIAFIIIQ
jgi:hypothetical protein